MPIRRGDLVLDAAGRFGLVLDVHAVGLLRVGMGDGTVVEVGASDLAPGPEPAANFVEFLGLDWADPHSPRYRPPPAEED